jgi:hypothetical protein
MHVKGFGCQWGQNGIQTERNFRFHFFMLHFHELHKSKICTEYKISLSVQESHQKSIETVIKLLTKLAKNITTYFLSPFPEPSHPINSHI